MRFARSASPDTNHRESWPPTKSRSSCGSVAAVTRSGPAIMEMLPSLRQRLAKASKRRSLRPLECEDAQEKQHRRGMGGVPTAQVAEARPGDQLVGEECRGTKPHDAPEGRIEHDSLRDR